MARGRCDDSLVNDTPAPTPTPAPGPSPRTAEGHDHAATASGRLDRALALVRFLRSACPWDAAQTADSLVPHLLEEAAETADAIHDGDADRLEDELGDLLLNLAFQIVVAEESGTLDAESVTSRLEAKMRRRHPHLYGDGPKESWEVIKARERGDAEGHTGTLSGLARGLDALTAAYRIQDRAAGVGFDWEDAAGAVAKVREELAEVEAEIRAGGEGSRREAGETAGGDPQPPAQPPDALVQEVGDLLFAAVNVARLVGVHPTTALAAANRKFTRRFEAVERLAADEGVNMGHASLDELDALWDRVKATERSG
jgi:MazG family protein